MVIGEGLLKRGQLAVFREALDRLAPLLERFDRDLVTAPDETIEFELEHYDGVLAFGEVIRERYIARGWARRAWTWHEAADTRVFHPGERNAGGDLVWIGNWGDEERSEEIRQYLIAPVRELRLRARVHGVRHLVVGR